MKGNSHPNWKSEFRVPTFVQKLEMENSITRTVLVCLTTLGLLRLAGFTDNSGLVINIKLFGEYNVYVDTLNDYFNNCMW